MGDHTSQSIGTVLITGAGGFIGSHLVDAFASLPRCEHVVAVVRNPSKARRTVPKTIFKVCDVADANETKALLQQVKPSVIIHTVSPGPFAPKAVQFAINFAATMQLLRIAKDNPDVKVFVYTSSAETVPLGFIDKPYSEAESPVKDLNSSGYYYGRTKGAADTMVRRENRLKPRDAYDWHGYLATATLRTAGVFGPRDTTITPAMLKLVNTFGACIQFGSDKKIHEWAFVENVALAHVLATKALIKGRAGVAGETFFITDGSLMTFGHFSRSIWKLAGDANMNSASPRFIQVPFWLLLPLLAVWEYVFRLITLGQKWPPISRQNFEYIRQRCWFSIEKARERLGYNPLCDTAEGIRRSVQWFEENDRKKGA